MPIQAHTERFGRVAVLHLTGHITLGEGSKVFRETASDLIDDGHSVIVLVVGDISYADSTGLGTLISTYTWAKNSGGEIVLVGSGYLTRLLESLNLQQLFRSFPTVEEALRSFGIQRPDATT